MIAPFNKYNMHQPPYTKGAPTYHGRPHSHVPELLLRIFRHPDLQFPFLSLKAEELLKGKKVYSRLSLNGHVYKTNTSVKRTPRVGLCLSPIPFISYTFYKPDTTLRRIFSSGGSRPSDKERGASHPDCEIRWGRSQKFFFFGSKNKGGTGPLPCIRHYLVRTQRCPS